MSKVTLGRTGTETRPVGQIETPWRGVRRPHLRSARWLTPAVVDAVLRLVGSDGHGIYADTAVQACGVPAAIVQALARQHVSTQTGGSIVGQDGAPLEEVWGVHGLVLLEALAREAAVPVVLATSWRVAAYHLAQALGQWLSAQGGTPPPFGPPPVPTIPPQGVATSIVPGADPDQPTVRHRMDTP